MAVTPLGQFTNEFFTKVGNAYFYVEDAAKAKVEDLTDKHSTLKTVSEWFTPDVQEKIAMALFAVGVIYNFMQNKLAFLGGTSLGILASAGKVPEWLRYQTLEGLQPKDKDSDPDVFMPMLSMKAEDGFQIQKTMVLLAFMNWYLGDTFLDNLFFGSFSGMITGNCLYHKGKTSIDSNLDRFEKTAIGNSFKSTYEGCANRVDDLVNYLFGKSA